ncbi:TonB C-terminal domain-containing protein [Candidatus Obscuribacterales bacterium]|nr:TonB C-terminal domain-containing protein [Candidatus Obscuribacterales bacterium]MBX3151452.1 TonB C-terminal domain-containing protein [Candidatus Obscuribacterales bacterium]
MNGTQEDAQMIQAAISENWRCDWAGQINSKVTFRLTKDGEIFDIHLTRGFDNPFIIKAVYHALLFSMPLPAPIDTSSLLSTCTISGDGQHPVFQVEFSESPGKPLDEEIKAIPAATKLPRHVFLYGDGAKRLDNLCQLLFFFPGSSELCGEIGKVCSSVGLDPQNSRDWIGIARSRNPEVPIMRNPSVKAKQSAQVAIAALLEAWRLRHDQSVLYKLEDAWLKFAAAEVLAASKADPLYLGTAALLTEQYKTACEQYDLSIKEGNALSKTIRDSMRAPSDKALLNNLMLPANYLPKGDVGEAWRPILNWLPVDTETLLVERKASNESFQADWISFFQPLVVEEGGKDFKASLGYSPKISQCETNKLFLNTEDILCIHAAKTFKPPDGLGGGSSDAIEILILSDSDKNISKKLMSRIQNECIYRQVVEGVEVLTFLERPWSYGSMFSGNSICSPCDGVIVSANSLAQLREVLHRLRTTPSERAFPQSLAEWKEVDTSSKLWALRHFDRSYLPFNKFGMYDFVTTKTQETHDEAERKESDYTLGTEIGFVFSSNKNKITLKYLSKDPAVLTSVGNHWRYMFNYDEYSEKQMSAKDIPATDDPSMRIDGDVVTVNGTMKEGGLLSMSLLMSLGYFIAI